MATIAKNQAKVIACWGFPSTTPEIRNGPEGASQTFIEGAFLKYTSGLLVAAVADDNDLVGIARENAHNTTGATIKYTPFVHGIVLEMTLLEGSAADHVAVTADRGAQYGFQISTNTYLDTSETTAGLFRIVEFPGNEHGVTDKGVIGDTNIRVRCVPLIATTAF